MMLKSLLAAALVAGIAGPAAAQAYETRDAARELRREQQDLRDARQFGDRRDVREQRRDVRDARQDLRQELREDRRAEQRYRAGRYVGPRSYVAGRSWGVGQVLPTGYYAERYWIGDPRGYSLGSAPQGYRWVRVGRDALLVTRSGRVEAVRRSLFY